MPPLNDESKRLLTFADEMEVREAEAMDEARDLSILLFSGGMSSDLLIQASDFLNTPVEEVWRLRALLNAIDDDLLALRCDG